jgi:hypothetical protein
LFGKGFTLLDFSGNITDTNAITAAASRVGLPLQSIKIDDPKVRETYERPLVLVRPDGHVAWRGDEIPENAAEIIDKIRGAG